MPTGKMLPVRLGRKQEISIEASYVVMTTRCSREGHDIQRLTVRASGNNTPDNRRRSEDQESAPEQG